MEECKVLVTGGAGYVGSVMVAELLRHGHRVTVLDNLVHRQQSLLACCANRRFEFVKGDICDEGLVKGLLPRFDVVVLLAAVVGAPACSLNPRLAKSVNRDANVNVAKNISRSQMVLYPNTNSGYGIGEKDSMCTEDSPLRPLSLYAETKVEVESVLLDSGNAVSFRLATVFGVSPRMRLDLLVNDFTFRACRDGYIVLFQGHFRRNFVHVRDVARVFLFGVENYGRMTGKAYNVGLSSANLTKRELCDRIAEQVPGLHVHEADIGDDPDKRDYIVSNDRIESLGWYPEHTLDEGIAELVRGHEMLKTSTFSNA